MVKNTPANGGDGSQIPGLGRSPGEVNGNPTPVFLAGKSHGQRHLAGWQRAGQDSVTEYRHHHLIV